MFPPYFPIPFFLANDSHFVGALGFGRGFQRESRVVAAGSVRVKPSGDEWMGQAVSNWLSNICAPSRATEVRMLLVSVLIVEVGVRSSEMVGRGFGSLASKCARSNV